MLQTVAAQVNGRAPVLFDGDIRSGMDLAQRRSISVPALLYRTSLTVVSHSQARRVEAVLRILADELDNTLALLGCADVSSLNREFLGIVAR